MCLLLCTWCSGMSKPTDVSLRWCLRSKSASQKRLLPSCLRELTMHTLRSAAVRMHIVSGLLGYHRVEYDWAILELNTSEQTSGRLRARMCSRTSARC